jgi:pimeloyl-ACP methyl ester carboxylesterase
VDLRTADGVRLAARLDDGPGPACVVLAHGFGGTMAGAPQRRIAVAMARAATVLSYDARGHGRSAGRTTLGDREALDVDAAVRWARSAGFGSVVTVGWSMGGAAVLRQAGLPSVEGHPLSAPDAVVSVSAAAVWDVPATAAVRRMRLLVSSSPGRLVARAALRTRIAAGVLDGPLPPVAAAPGIGVPLLLVHGTADACFGVEQAQLLHDAAPGSQLWLEEFGHAETGATPELLDRLTSAVSELVTT